MAEKNNYIYKTWIYKLVLLLCIGVSSNLSFKGFTPSFDTIYMTYAVVAIIGLVLLCGGLILEDARVQGSTTGIWAAIIVYFSAAIFSWTSNFTAVYTEREWLRVKTTAVIQEQEKFAASIDSLKLNVAVLKRSPELPTGYLP